MLARDVAAETFVDHVTRRRVDNFAEFEALYGDAGSTIAELDLPRVQSARQLPRPIHRRLAERAGALSADPAEAAQGRAAEDTGRSTADLVARHSARAPERQPQTSSSARCFA